MQLYVDAQYLSPYAMSAYVALRTKNLPFEEVPVDLAAGQHCHGAYAQRSITRRIPMLVHGEFALSESSAIAEYLDETCSGPKLYPTDPPRRARVRQVQAWLRSDLLALRKERPTEVIFCSPTGRPLSRAGRNAADKLLAVAEAVISAADEHVAGKWSIADLDLALMLNRLLINGDAVPKPLRDYAIVQWERPAVQEWLEKPRARS